MTTFRNAPTSQDHPLRLPPWLRRLRAEGPVHRVRTPVGDLAWLVTGYREVRELFVDPRLGRAHPDPVRAARSGQSALIGGPMGHYQTQDAGDARMRALLQPSFSPARMRALRPRVAALTADLLDEMARLGPPADLNAALAFPLPLLVICELLGVPFEDRASFTAWTEAIADVGDRVRSELGLASLYCYGEELVAYKREHPGDDVISRLCAVDGVSDIEITMLSMGLLFAGHETTVAAIGTGVLYLLSHPEQWQALHDNPGLITTAVEEILRVPARGSGIPRYARSDIQVGGVTIRAGDLVLLNHGAANHDEAAFPDAERFDVARQAAPHLSFGYGPRYCIGAPLARIELQTVFSQLIPRFPRLRLTVPVTELRRSEGSAGLAGLSVTWLLVRQQHLGADYLSPAVVAGSGLVLVVSSRGEHPLRHRLGHPARRPSSARRRFPRQPGPCAAARPPPTGSATPVTRVHRLLIPGKNRGCGRNLLLPGPRSHDTPDTPSQPHRYPGTALTCPVSASENDRSPGAWPTAGLSPRRVPDPLPVPDREAGQGRCRLWLAFDEQAVSPVASGLDERPEAPVVGFAGGVDRQVRPAGDSSGDVGRRQHGREMLTKVAYRAA
jgi:cytochrome P450